MLVYRDGAHEVSTLKAQSALLCAIDRIAGEHATQYNLEALLRAGELECALADQGAEAARGMQQVSDTLAASLLTAAPALDTRCRSQLRQIIAHMKTPRRIRVKEPEGYAYYALDPRQYAAMIAQLELGPEPVAIVGIRSIGTSLSAVVLAAVRARGLAAERITVRPGGAPWSRSLQLSERERAFVITHVAAAARVLIVDEGPGLSGSTFLAVAEALEQQGVPRTHITLCCSHDPDPERLVAPQAAERWCRYGRVAPRAVARRGFDVSAGAWRWRAYEETPDTWPACWTQLERVKYLSRDGRSLEKFEGLPPYCEAGQARAYELARAGMAPAPSAARDGFVSYPWIAGRPAQRRDLSPALLERMADYCAFRARAFPAPHAEPTALQEMTRINVQEALSTELSITLELRAPVIADARMQPHEWCLAEDGRVYKIDGHADGDGHLFPGPVDICWDLAGAIVEWNMDGPQRHTLVQRYERQSGDDVGRRLPGYLTAYSALRVGEMTMAELSAAASELGRLRAARQAYERALVSHVRAEV